MYFLNKKSQPDHGFWGKYWDVRCLISKDWRLEYFNKVVLMALFGLLWVWQQNSVALTPPIDNIEQWVWSHALQWGYHKHPPLPTWLLYVPQMLTGPTAWTSQVLGALCTLISVGIFANLIRQIWGKPLAGMALLAALCITFYNGRLNYYNHNILLLLFVALSAQCWWMILQNGQRRWWIGLGLCAGLGMLSKYQYLLVVVPSAYFLWHIKPWRKPQQLQGLMWAVGTALLVFSPHLWWLLQQDLANSPIRYALNTSLPEQQLQSSPIINRVRSGVWLLDLLFNRCLPALLFLWLVRAFCFNKAALAPDPPPPERPSVVWHAFSDGLGAHATTDHHHAGPNFGHGPSEAMGDRLCTLAHCAFHGGHQGSSHPEFSTAAASGLGRVLAYPGEPDDSLLPDISIYV